MIGAGLVRSAMNPAEKALWFVESHFARDISLDEVAAVGGVSRYHMTRAFAAATGMSVFAYAKARRLSEAAKKLSQGAPDILTVALDAGYGSHEAFTRAFRDQFGVTPEQLRQGRILDIIQLVEPIAMADTPPATLAPPRIETGRTLLIAGLSERYTHATSAAIPSQWQQFHPHIGHVPGQIGNIAYGVFHNIDDSGNMDYITGVEVADFSDLPKTFARLRIPEHLYAVFSHQGHISAIRGTMHAIWNSWLPQSDYQASDAPGFERYDERFNPDTGLGGFEIWIPVKK
jgi:AraC family transcriptional regulator